MTRDILLFGELRAISLDSLNGNGDIVRGLDKDYSTLTNIKVHFDTVPTKELGEIMLVFLMDGEWENENTNSDYVSNIQACIITGDNGKDGRLPYSFVGDIDCYKKLLTIDYFEKMWRKISDEMGGDSFILKSIFYTANGIYVFVKFEV